ncbi:SPARC-related modular calcium-binding protein 2 [Pteropus vampyrus]|uniref:SPARC-related modular calcium-binding protein 2 n=1 Tax=Pteropus vampyrus TaxID=132908 RepID=A0A6P3RKF3_PTEVA|nr:SPARC-related modular calcium-binding protein 2 [Pteropus vampyrus]
MLLPQLCWLPLLAGLLPPAPAQKFSALTFLRVDQDKDKDCSLDCGGSPQKPLCASDGRTFLSRCEFQRAKCKDPQLEIAYRGSCKEHVQCHSYTGYCWCVTSNGRPISGTAVAHKTPRCPGSIGEKLPQREGTGRTGTRRNRQPLPPDPALASGLVSHGRLHVHCRRPVGTALFRSVRRHEERVVGHGPAAVTAWRVGTALFRSVQRHEERVVGPGPAAVTAWRSGRCVRLLWRSQVPSLRCVEDTPTSPRLPPELASCDEEQQSALEEARQPKNDNVVVPECAHGGLYKPVQCHLSTGYCWCVLVDTGRPVPGTSTRYEQPKCDHTARAHPIKARDLYKGRQLPGCPGAKKNEFLTSVLDALSTDMVHAVSDPSAPGRLSEPDPSHTLEERVVHWYFKLLDKNSSGDIGKKEIKPFKRFLRKKSKPKKCVKRFVDYCDANNDKSLSVHELMGCLGVTEEEGRGSARKRHTRVGRHRPCAVLRLEALAGYPGPWELRLCSGTGGGTEE